jgi:hypothetical protein
VQCNAELFRLHSTSALVLCTFSLRPEKMMFCDFSDRLVDKRNVLNTLSVSHMVAIKKDVTWFAS